MGRMLQFWAVHFPSPLSCFCITTQPSKQVRWPVTQINFLSILRPPVACVRVLKQNKIKERYVSHDGGDCGGEKATINQQLTFLTLNMKRVIWYGRPEGTGRGYIAAPRATSLLVWTKPGHVRSKQPVFFDASAWFQTEEKIVNQDLCWLFKNGWDFNTVTYLWS